MFSINRAEKQLWPLIARAAQDAGFNPIEMAIACYSGLLTLRENNPPLGQLLDILEANRKEARAEGASVVTEALAASVPIERAGGGVR
jgi:hypothetical protein